RALHRRASAPFFVLRSRSAFDVYGTEWRNRAPARRRKQHHPTRSWLSRFRPSSRTCPPLLAGVPQSGCTAGFDPRREPRLIALSILRPSLIARARRLQRKQTGRVRRRQRTETRDLLFLTFLCF